MFKRVLIANRGEIACRVMRTCQRMGIDTVAVYSDVDASALHVRMADQAVCLGGATASESYLNMEKVLKAAKETGSTAIHPGYGFLSENDIFADACAAVDVTFIGPPASAIRAMGSKSAAKTLMGKAGVPLTPGYHGTNQSPDFLLAQAALIGYPVLIKAIAGGGGKGMRRVDAPQDFLPALMACQREARASFGDERVLLEQYVLQPRHIEIQVFADTFGNVVSLFERDCSVQRRHQKVIEEAPAAGMTTERRASMGRAACDAARAVGYVGAGTVEFIVDKQGAFHFMEMNTRLQVEHPVTEMITGLDLVEWQLRVAAGERLPHTQDQLHLRGHALEARLYAEEPANGFRPSTGRLIHLKVPKTSEHVRVDSGVEQGDEITSFYDPMMAKIIVWDEDRERAIARMQRALTETQIVGVGNNVVFLQGVIASRSFREGSLDTGLIEREQDWLNAERPIPAFAFIFASIAQALSSYEATPDMFCAPSPWALRNGWRSNRLLRKRLEYAHGNTRTSVIVEFGRCNYAVEVSERTYTVSRVTFCRGEMTAEIDGLTQHATVITGANHVHIFGRDCSYKLSWIDPLATKIVERTSDSSLLSPIPGLLKALLVSVGEPVEKGRSLLVLEAMKMEYTIVAPTFGRVVAFFFAAGDQVPEAIRLLEFEPLTDGEADEHAG